MENTTNLKIAVIGVGNGGSQSAISAVVRGIPAMVVNTSEKDMNDALIGQNIKGYVIGDGRGSGKDRDNAMALLKSNGKAGLQNLLENPYLREIVEPADIVFVTFSTGGGTGSGIGPTIANLIHRAYAQKVVIPFGILPKNAESVMAQANTIACVDDITKLGTPYMLADLSFYENESQELAFDKIGRYMADTMCVIRGDYLRLSTAGMADERDMLTVISEPGYMVVERVDGITDSMLAGKTLQGYLVDSLKSSPACRIQKDGLLQYDMVIDTISEFEVACIISGCSIPMDRFASAKAKVKANKEKYEKQSALNLATDREATSLKGNEKTRGAIMGSANSNKADLSFLDEI